VNDYKKYSNIIIEVIPFMPYQKGTKGFIDIKYDKNYCHVYFNDDTEEIKWNYFTSGDNVQKIKIVLDYRIQSLNGIFSSWKWIKKANFINFKRNNINSFNNLYIESSVEEINFYDFPEKSITNMKELFNGCKSLKTINWYSFDTSNVTNMSGMFNYCSIESLNLSNFDTSKVTNMSDMFNYCSSLKSLNVSNFDTSKVTDMNGMFGELNELEVLDLSNFRTENVIDMTSMSGNVIN